MKQRYVYIIRRGESIRAVETRAANARTLLFTLKCLEPDRPRVGDGADAVKQWFEAIQAYDAEWHLERHPIGPASPTEKDKPADKPAAAADTPASRRKAAALHPDCDVCIYRSAGGSPWCTLHLCKTPRPRCEDYTPAAGEPAAPDGERDSATRRAQ